MERDILKKSRGLLRQGERGTLDAFRFILAEKANFPVKVMCEVLDVSTSGFYGWRDWPPSLRARRDMVILDKIRCIHTESRETYGSPRIHFELKNEHDIYCGRKRVARLMVSSGIRGCCRRPFS